MPKKLQTAALAPDPLARLYRACEPSKDLEPGDPRYVDLDEVRGDSVVRLFEKSLRLADPEHPEVKLLAGHIGSGKTSEMRRLKAQLEQVRDGSRPFLVLYLDVVEQLDLNDLDFPDLLVFVAAEVQRQLAEAKLPGFSPITSELKRIWDDIRGVLGSEIRASGASFSGPFGGLALELRNRPSRRTELRQAIERQSTTLLMAVNDVLQTARAEVRRDGERQGIVLLIDGLEKMTRRPLDDGVSNTHDRLFIDRSEQLAALDAHVVYTVPISLLYSPRCARLEQAFGEHSLIIPMVRLRGDNQGPVRPDTPGMQKMEEMLRKRCAFAQVDFEEAFVAPAARFLCEMSGGHPRHLMMFVQSALLELDQLPLTEQAAQRAVSKYANSLQRSVTDEAWERLRFFEVPRFEIPKDELHQLLLYQLWVFEYLSGTVWWEVNPVFRTIDRFRSGTRA